MSGRKLEIRNIKKKRNLNNSIYTLIKIHTSAKDF